MSRAINIFNENISNRFDRAEFNKLIDDNSISGQIIIENINIILNKLIEYNICGNRNNYLLGEGFLDGDIFFIPNGLTFLLSIDYGLHQIYNYDIVIRLK
jgi:hypothetical protein